MKKVTFPKIIVVILTILFAGFVGVYGRWYQENYFAKQAADYIDMEAENQKRAEAEKQYIDAMTADTYGGKTPEETLRLFIEALKGGDIELASKYFALETNTQDPDYLTRKRWENYFRDIQERGLLKQMADDIERDVKSLSKEIEDNRFSYALFNEDGTVGISIDLKLNTYSQVWKIESL